MDKFEKVKYEKPEVELISLPDDVDEIVASGCEHDSNGDGINDY